MAKKNIRVEKGIFNGQRFVRFYDGLCKMEGFPEKNIWSVSAPIIESVKDGPAHVEIFNVQVGTVSGDAQSVVMDCTIQESEFSKKFSETGDLYCKVYAEFFEDAIEIIVGNYEHPKNADGSLSKIPGKDWQYEVYIENGYKKCKYTSGPLSFVLVPEMRICTICIQSHTSEQIVGVCGLSSCTKTFDGMKKIVREKRENYSLNRELAVDKELFDKCFKALNNVYTLIEYSERARIMGLCCWYPMWIFS